MRKITIQDTRGNFRTWRGDQYSFRRNFDGVEIWEGGEQPRMVAFYDSLLWVEEKQEEQPKQGVKELYEMVREMAATELDPFTARDLAKDTPAPDYTSEQTAAEIIAEPERCTKCDPLGECECKK